MPTWPVVGCDLLSWLSRNSPSMRKDATDISSSFHFLYLASQYESDSWSDMMVRDMREPLAHRWLGLSPRNANRKVIEACATRSPTAHLLPRIIPNKLLLDADRDPIPPGP